MQHSDSREPEGIVLIQEQEVVKIQKELNKWLLCCLTEKEKKQQVFNSRYPETPPLFLHPELLSALITRHLHRQLLEAGYVWTYYWLRWETKKSMNGLSGDVVWFSKCLSVGLMKAELCCYRAWGAETFSPQ